MKKCFNILMAVMMILSLNAPMVEAKDFYEREDLVIKEAISETDAILIAGSILNAPDGENGYLLPGAKLKEIVELYNERGEHIAYYVSFLPTGYAVINNDASNPAVIEFGELNNELIEKALDDKNNSIIVYNNPMEVYEFNRDGITMNGKPDLYSYYPALKRTDSKAANQLKKLRNLSKSYMSNLEDKYNIVNLEDLPSGKFDMATIKGYYSTEWVQMKEFSSIAKNHCGATAVTNLAMYFVNRGYTDLLVNNSSYDTFVAIHDIIGDGPVMTIANGARIFFKDQGYTLKYSAADGYNAIKLAIGKNRPCGILLSAGIVDWHWVVCIGYREYVAGNQYLRVIDGWSSSTTKYYLENSDTTRVSATQYWIQ